jgi:cysteine desulfurase family protein (TIGR01976 family)
MSGVTETFDVEAARAHFAALRDESRAALFDTPGGSQVPDTVREAITAAMRDAAANLGGTFAASRRVAEIVRDARAAAARFLGCSADEVIFGQNMTTINFALSRAVARELQAGDEIVVTRLDHDASVSPWVAIAEDVGATVKVVGIDEATCTLDWDDLEAQIGERTRVVAFSWASNSVGTIIDAARVCRLAHAVGALAWIDATHYAAHLPIDVRAIDADVLVCSPYKFCGPHLGLAYGRAEVIGQWRPYKVRPAPVDPVGARFETGTQPYEQLAGFVAAIDYWESVDANGAGHAWARALGERFLAGLPDGIRLIGAPTMEGRLPTFLLGFGDREATPISDALVERGFNVTASESFYCLGLRDLIGSRKAVRVGLFHYNTEAEVDRLLAALTELA